MMNRFTRREFYELVWSEPAHTLGPRLGISEAGLGKVCRRHSIAVPGRNYWTRLEAGETVIKRPLAPRRPGMSDTVLIGTEEHEPEDLRLKRILAEPIPPLPTFDEDMARVVNRVRRLVATVRVPRTLDRAHPLVARLLAADERRRLKQQVSGSTVRSDPPLFASPIAQRRLRIINGLFLALQHLGFRPWIRDRQAHALGVAVGQQDVGFILESIPERRSVERPGFASTGNPPAHGRLRLTMRPWHSTDSNGRSWEDTKEAKIEHHARNIVIELIIAGEAQHRTSVLAYHRWLVERKEELAAEVQRLREERAHGEDERLAQCERARLGLHIGRSRISGDEHGLFAHRSLVPFRKGVRKR